MWDSSCGFPPPLFRRACLITTLILLLSFSCAWQAFSNTYHTPRAASQPTCLRKTDLLLPATPSPLRMITRCQETSAITVWKTDACQVSHATGFPCRVLSQHGPCCPWHGPAPALHLLGQHRHPVGGVAWPSAGDAPLVHHPLQHPFTPPENWYWRDNSSYSWLRRILFPYQNKNNSRPFC